MRAARVAIRPLFALVIVLAFIGQFLLTSEKALAISIGSGSTNPTAFMDAYNRIGGSAAIGTPFNDVHPWGPGCIQDFSGGRFGRSAIMQRGCSGPAFSVVGEHWNWMVAHYGSQAADVVGYPANEGHRWGNTWTQDFDGGQVGWNILIRPDVIGRVHQLRGAILRKYFEHGNINSFLGFPISDEYPWNGEQRQDYQNGTIIWNSAEGARAARNFPQGSLIVATSLDPKVYVIVGGRRFWVLTGETIDLCWGGWGRLQYLSAEEMRAVYKLYPDGGSNVCYPENTMIVAAGYDPKVYVVRNNRLYWVVNGESVNCLGGWNKIRYISPNELNVAKSVYPYGGEYNCLAISSREQRAVDWAKSQIGQTSYGGHIWSGWCELFVEQAFNTSGKYGSAAANYNAKKAAGQIRTDTNPPAGALVFYSWGSFGHAGLSIGGGQVISTQGDGSLALPVRQHGVTSIGLTYLGWAWADSSWPGR